MQWSNCVSNAGLRTEIEVDDGEVWRLRGTQLIQLHTDQKHLTDRSSVSVLPKPITSVVTLLNCALRNLTGVAMMILIENM